MIPQWADVPLTQLMDVEAVLSKIKFPGARFWMRSMHHLMVEFTTSDVFSGPATQVHITHTVEAPDTGWTEHWLVRACLGLCLSYALHECREHFFYDGTQPVFPHRDGDDGLTIHQNLRWLAHMREMFEELCGVELGKS